MENSYVLLRLGGLGVPSTPACLLACRDSDGGENPSNELAGMGFILDETPDPDPTPLPAPVRKKEFTLSPRRFGVGRTGERADWESKTKSFRVRHPVASLLGLEWTHVCGAETAVSDAVA